MKLKVNFKGVAINKKEEKSRDGQKTYYRMSIDQDGEAGTVGITEDIFNQVERFKEYDFVGEYNDMYKSFRIIGVAAVGINKNVKA